MLLISDTLNLVTLLTKNSLNVAIWLFNCVTCDDDAVEFDRVLLCILKTVNNAITFFETIFKFPLFNSIKSGLLASFPVIDSAKLWANASFGLTSTGLGKL